MFVRDKKLCFFLHFRTVGTFLVFTEKKINFYRVIERDCKL